MGEQRPGKVIARGFYMGIGAACAVGLIYFIFSVFHITTNAINEANDRERLRDQMQSEVHSAHEAEAARKAEAALQEALRNSGDPYSVYDPASYPSDISRDKK